MLVNRILRESEIRSPLDPAGCLQAVEAAFSAYVRGQAELCGTGEISLRGAGRTVLAIEEPEVV